MKKLLILATIFLCAYSRADYKHWIDQDGDCQDTRQEVLIRQSIVEPVFDNKGCHVEKGKWFDPYTGRIFTNPHLLDIDHVVPLSNIDKNGGSKWSASKKALYANSLDDKNVLLAVSASENRAKGDKDPSRWMPKNRAFHCEYLQRWKNIKERWGIEMTKREKVFIKEQLINCYNN